MGRLGADAQRMIEAARELARKHRHAAVEPEHLLAALLQDDRVEIVLSQRALDREHLQERIESRLAEWPGTGVYRDGRAELGRSDAFDSLLVRAGATSLMSFVRPVTFDDLARAACTEPRLAPLFHASNSPPGSGAEMFAQAETFALARGDGSVTVFHLLHALVEQPAMASALEEVGVDRAHLVARLRERLGQEPRFAELLAGVYRGGSRGELVNALLAKKAVERVLVDAGVSALDLKRAMVRSTRGTVDDGTLPDPADGEIDVVFHDDDFTTMAIVVDLLRDCFEIEDADAMALMLRVHKNGSAVVKTCPASEARAQIEGARARARQEGVPLAISWRQSEPDHDDA